MAKASKALKLAQKLAYELVQVAQDPQELVDAYRTLVPQGKAAGFTPVVLAVSEAFIDELLYEPEVAKLEALGFGSEGTSASEAPLRSDSVLAKTAQLERNEPAKAKKTKLLQVNSARIAQVEAQAAKVDAKALIADLLEPTDFVAAPEKANGFEWEWGAGLDFDEFGELAEAEGEDTVYALVKLACSPEQVLTHLPLFDGELGLASAQLAALGKLWANYGAQVAAVSLYAIQFYFPSKQSLKSPDAFFQQMWLLT